MDAGFRKLAVLDLSENALAASEVRLGQWAHAVDWIVADVRTWQPPQSYDVWHDRAAFHFLTDPDDQAAYAECVRRPYVHAIVGNFALDGPERCSGLPVVRHDSASIGRLLGPSFTLAESRRHEHLTPLGTVQRFQFGPFRRVAESGA